MIALSLSLKGNIQIPFDDAKATHLLPNVDGGEVTVNNVQAAAATVVDELSNVLHGGETATCWSVVSWAAAGGSIWPSYLVNSFEAELTFKFHV